MSQFVHFKNYYGKHFVCISILIIPYILLLLIVVSQSTSSITTDRVSTTSILPVIILLVIATILIFSSTSISSIHIWPGVNIIRIATTDRACICRILWIYARLNLKRVTLLKIDSQVIRVFRSSGCHYKGHKI